MRFRPGIPRLAPAFDQVSMLYAPTADGQVPTRVLTLPNVTSDTLDVWDDAREGRASVLGAGKRGCACIGRRSRHLWNQRPIAREGRAWRLTALSDVDRV